MIEDSICLRKSKEWFSMLSPVGKIEFLEYLWQTEPHKMDYSSMSEPLRRFYSPSAERPKHHD